VRIEVREIDGTEQTARLEFAVVDTGIGIPVDQQALLFQPFSQADSSTTRQFGGSGLGLSIVKSLARLMDGEVGVDSTPGQGSRFWFRVRAGRVAAGSDSRQLPRTGAPPTTRAPGGYAGRVLVVEDNPTNQKVIQALLGRAGATTVLAENGQLAVAAIMAGESADLILMDLQMPVMDGYAATERIRRWEQDNGRPRRPIVAVTADAFEEDRRRCLDAGMDDFLAKPIASDALTAVLDRWLRRLPAAAAPPCTAGPSADAARLAASAAELLPMLASNQFAAIARSQELLQDAAGNAVADELADVVRLLEEFRFAAAHERLCRIAAAQGWRGPTAT
jgi:CheY-like chemotaxis protein